MALIDSLLRFGGLKSNDPERMAAIDAAQDVENKLDLDARRHILQRGFQGYDTDKYVDAYKQQYAFQTSIKSSVKGQNELLLELIGKLEEVVTEYNHVKAVVQQKNIEINSSIVVDEIKEASHAFEQNSNAELDKLIAETETIIANIRRKL